MSGAVSLPPRSSLEPSETLVGRIVAGVIGRLGRFLDERMLRDALFDAIRQRDRQWDDLGAAKPDLPPVQTARELAEGVTDVPAVRARVEAAVTARDAQITARLCRAMGVATDGGPSGLRAILAALEELAAQLGAVSSPSPEPEKR